MSKIFNEFSNEYLIIFHEIWPSSNLTFYILQFQLASSTHSLEKRDYVIRELVDTESNYVDVLGKIDKYFIKVLSSIMKQHDIHVIFYGIKVFFLIQFVF